MVKRIINRIDFLDALGLLGIIMLGGGLWLLSLSLSLIVVGSLLTGTYLWPAFLAALWSARGERE